MSIKEIIDDCILLGDSFIDLNRFRVMRLKLQNWRIQREERYTVGDLVYIESRDSVGKISSIGNDKMRGIHFNIDWKDQNDCNRYIPNATVYPMQVRRATKQERFIFTLGIKEVDNILGADKMVGQYTYPTLGEAFVNKYNDFNKIRGN